MDQNELLQLLNAGETIIAGSQAHREMIRISNESMKLTARLNSAYHTPEEVREIFSRIIGAGVDESFCLSTRLRLDYDAFP